MPKGTDFVAIVECAAGNESVGTEWLESYPFTAETTLREVWEWRQNLPTGAGRLVVTAVED